MELLDSNVETDPKKLCEHWTTQIQAAEKRLEKYYRRGDKIDKRYIDERTNKGDDRRDLRENAGTNPFRLNLFHTHVSTLISMLYGQLPRVDVSRRFNDSRDDVARVAATMLQRILNTSIEEPGADFPATLRACLQDRLLPGHGIPRVRYSFETRAQAQVTNDAPQGDEYSAEGEIVDESTPSDRDWETCSWFFD